MVCTSTPQTEDGAATKTEADQSLKLENVPKEAEHGKRPKSGNINMVLANAGQSLEGADAELVLNPLRLAFETKNLKILEPALDCLHVCACFTPMRSLHMAGGREKPFHLIIEYLHYSISSKIKST